MLTTSIYLIGVGNYIVNPAQIAYMNLEAETLTVAFVAGGSNGPMTISLEGEDGRRFLQLLQNHAPIHK